MLKAENLPKGIPLFTHCGTVCEVELSYSLTEDYRMLRYKDIKLHIKAT